MSRITRFTRLGINITQAFRWKKHKILDFATNLAENPAYGIPSDRLPFMKTAAELLGTKSPVFTGAQQGLLEPKSFPFHDKEMQFTSIHDILGYVMTNAVNPSLPENPAGEENLRALLALYCKWMTVLQGAPTQAPSAAHVAYDALPPKEIVFSANTPSEVAFGASVAVGGVAKPSYKRPARLLRFKQLEEQLGSIEQHIKAHKPPKVWGRGSKITLAQNQQLFGNCAETLAWIAMLSAGRGQMMGGMTLDVLSVAEMEEYNASEVVKHHLELCENCRFLLEKIIGGNPQNFDLPVKPMT